LITANTTLSEDKATVLAVWSALGGSEDMLRIKYDDVSEWFGVTVIDERVTSLDWGNKVLGGEIDPQIGALSALRYLNLAHNNLKGSIPPTVAALAELTVLSLSSNTMSGAVPPALSNLTNLAYLGLAQKHHSSGKLHSVGFLGLDNVNTLHLTDHSSVQAYLNSLWFPMALHFISRGIAITKKLLEKCSPTIEKHMSRRRHVPSPPNPFFAFLANNEDVADHTLSFLDPLNHGL